MKACHKVSINPITWWLNSIPWYQRTGFAMAVLTVLYQALTTEPGSLEISLPNVDLCTFPRKVSAWFYLSPHSSLGITGGFFPCQLALVGKQGKAAEQLGLGGTQWITVWQRSAVITLGKGSVGMLCCCGNQRQQSGKLQKAEPIKQQGVSNTQGPPGTGPWSIRGKVNIKSPQWGKGSQGKQSMASHHGLTVTGP